ncbi:hypothetical protein EST38_g3254 [Candolleomyces aberdarensis]|uniref:Uncharacterized protein n=1 Tax=Candolleomyces aberdarensis TaxID=2316362 RepID=A0A4Q2DQE3_9AGAR|nr:hypothetical protein EST38_g3254 [Candolleomyces aberdarensis]
MDQSFQQLNDEDIRSLNPKDTDHDEAMRVFALSKALRPLTEEDIRPIGEPEENTPGITGETRKTISWIWRQGTVGKEDSDEELRVEWAKSRARAERYDEEIRIVEEEMRRTLRFLSWKSEGWYEKRDVQASRQLSAAVLDGMQAYAERQADMWYRLGHSFQNRWKGVPEVVGKARDMVAKPELWYEAKDKEEEMKEKTRLKRMAKRATRTT